MIDTLSFHPTGDAAQQGISTFMAEMLEAATILQVRLASSLCLCLSLCLSVDALSGCRQNESRPIQPEPLLMCPITTTTPIPIRRSSHCAHHIITTTTTTPTDGHARVPPHHRRAGAVRTQVVDAWRDGCMEGWRDGCTYIQNQHPPQTKTHHPTPRPQQNYIKTTHIIVAPPPSTGLRPGLTTHSHTHTHSHNPPHTHKNII